MTTVSIPFKRESVSKELIPWQKSRQRLTVPVSIPFKRESVSKEELENLEKEYWNEPVSIPFKRESVSKDGMEFCRRRAAVQRVSIPFKRESVSKDTPFCTQSGRGSVPPKTKRELRGAFFNPKFAPKIPRTLMNIDPNAIF